MGHPTVIFSPKPSPSIECAICYDVLQDASSLKECGHTFCDVCIKNCLQRNPSCPNCRVAVTGSNPNYPLREIIEALQVSCPELADDDESGNKRKRGCDWEGSLKGLKVHENECPLKKIACNVDGCGHTCKRKDMESHLSSTKGMMMHMESRHKNEMKGMELRYKRGMKALELTCENKMKAQDQKYEKKLKKKLKELESSIHTKIKDTYEQSLINDAGVGRQGYGGFTGRSSLKDAVIQCIKTMGAHSDSGVHIDQVTARLVVEQGFRASEIKITIDNLSNEGEIYTTIDEDNYQCAR